MDSMVSTLDVSQLPDEKGAQPGAANTLCFNTFAFNKIVYFLFRCEDVS